jgi:FtsH-binding integral membrane protein
VEATRNNGEPDQYLEGFKYKSRREFLAIVLGWLAAALVVAAVVGLVVALVSWFIDSPFLSVWLWVTVGLFLILVAVLGILLLLWWQAARKVGVPTSLIYEAWTASYFIARMRRMTPEQLKTAVAKHRAEEAAKEAS